MIPVKALRLPEGYSVKVAGEELSAEELVVDGEKVVLPSGDLAFYAAVEVRKEGGRVYVFTLLYAFSDFSVVRGYE